jgi:uncharacterized protein (DUF58 family)
VPRPRKRAATLLVGAGVLFFLGTNVQAGWLFVLAAFLAGTAVSGMLLPGRMLRGLRVERRVPGEVHQLDDVLVDLAVTNMSRGLRISILIEDSHLESTRVFMTSLRPGETLEATTVRKARRRGLIETSEVILRTRAPFGVAERRRRVPAAGSTLVLPAVLPLGRLSFVESAITLDRAMRSSPRMGHGPEYLGVREYRPGDSMRHVHWPSTARTGTVMVREFEEETTRRLAIVLDSSFDVGDTWTPLDRCCAAAASIALAAEAHGQGAKLVVAEGGSIEVVARVDARELLRRLALLVPDNSVPFGETVGGLDAELRGVETAVLVFPTWRANDGPGLAPAVLALRSRIPRVVAIPIEVPVGQSGAPALEPGALAGLERQLLAAGAEVRIWRSDADLDVALGDETGGERDRVGIEGVPG